MVMNVNGTRSVDFLKNDELSIYIDGRLKELENNFENIISSIEKLESKIDMLNSNIEDVNKIKDRLDEIDWRVGLITGEVVNVITRDTKRLEDKFEDKLHCLELLYSKETDRSDQSLFYKMFTFLGFIALVTGFLVFVLMIVWCTNQAFDNLII